MVGFCSFFIIDLNIESLVERIKQEGTKEIILALKGSMEGDTTAFYIYRKLKDFDCMISIIARGISIGDELEYADEISLGRSIMQRTPFENTLKGWKDFFFENVIAA